MRPYFYLMDLPVWHPCKGSKNFCRRVVTQTRVFRWTWATSTSHPKLAVAPFSFRYPKIISQKTQYTVHLKSQKIQQKFKKSLFYSSPNGSASSLCLLPYRLSANETPETSQYLETILRAFSSRTGLLLTSSITNSPKVIILAGSRPQFSQHCGAIVIIINRARLFC